MCQSAFCAAIKFLNLPGREFVVEITELNLNRLNKFAPVRLGKTPYLL
jgi:hypothetical protein